jgi:CheY-like chemotaxis protein
MAHTVDWMAAGNGFARWHRGSHLDNNNLPRRYLVANTWHHHSCYRLYFGFRRFFKLCPHWRWVSGPHCGYGQLLGIIASGPQAEKQKSYVDQILNGGKHLLDLIGKVLDLSAIETGQIQLVREKFSVMEACQDCLTLINTQAADRGLEIESSMESDNAIEADYVRFKQILLNLLSNAIKYNHEAGKIGLACTDLPDNLVRLSVTDTGDGIAMDRQGDLFSPFKRLGKESGQIEGAGIGLTITKQLAEAIGGQVGFESELGVGSTFWIEFLIYEGTGIETKVQTNAQEVVGRQERIPIRAKILYIEDNLANQDLMESIFDEMDGLTLFSARTAETGLTMAKDLQPDLILMDINLPGMDGIEAMNALRAFETTKEIPVIAVSAAVMKDDYERGMAAGFKAYLTKPFEVAKLVEAITIELQA